MAPDLAAATEGSALSTSITGHDPVQWHVRWTLEKREGDAAEGQSIDDFLATVQPYDVLQGEGNILVNAGIALMEDLLIGAGGTVYSNANASIGVGDSTTAAATNQVDLSASPNKTRVAMDATFPSRSGQTVTWRMSAGTSVANWAWQEWAIFNTTSQTGGTMLNRKVESLGTKASGTWTLAVSVTIS